jgi:hypothetical protein
MDHVAVESFFRAMAPTLFANIVTVALVYAFVSYSKKEKTGVEVGRGTGIDQSMLSKFVSEHRARFINEHDNTFAFSWAKVFRRCAFMGIIEGRYEAASAAFIANSEAVRKAIPVGTALVSPELAALMSESYPLKSELDLEIESYYLFAKIVLDDVARGIEYYFGPQRGLALNSHDDLAKRLEAYATAKGLTLSREFLDNIVDLKRRICDFRDQQIAHETSPRTTHATTWSRESGSRMVGTRLYPKATDSPSESATPVELRVLVKAYLDQVAEFLYTNEAKTNLKLEVTRA